MLDWNIRSPEMGPQGCVNSGEAGGSGVQSYKNLRLDWLTWFSISKKNKILLPAFSNDFFVFSVFPYEPTLECDTKGKPNSLTNDGVTDTPGPQECEKIQLRDPGKREEAEQFMFRWNLEAYPYQSFSRSWHTTRLQISSKLHGKKKKKKKRWNPSVQLHCLAFKRVSIHCLYYRQ